jgi:hypothetical protein
MDGKGFSPARSVRIILVLAAALAGAACSPLGLPPEAGNQTPNAVSSVRGTAGQPGYPAPTAQASPLPSPIPPTPIPPTPLSPQTITIDTPGWGTPVGSPVVITGHTARLPRNGMLNYRFTDSAGQQLGAGQFPVSGTPGQPASFNATLNFNLPNAGGPVTIELSERADAYGQGGAMEVRGMVVESQYQDIFIDTPSASTIVGSPLVLTGRTMRAPAQGVLSYRVLNSAGQQIGDGDFPVSGDPGAQRYFNADLYFNLPIDGDTITVELNDWNANGASEAYEPLSLVVLPIPQEIIFESPPAMVLVGSPLVLIGRTTRYPFGGDLSYRITNDAGQVLGANSFRVAGAAGQPATFKAEPTFQVPREGGTIHLNVYDQDPSNGAETASNVLDLDVRPQYPWIYIDTPPDGTQVGSPVVLTGRMNIYPASGQLTYRVLDANNQQIGSGSFPVDGSPGGRGSYVGSLTFNEPPNGGNITVELADGNIRATASLYVAPPPPQQVLIDTPSPGTQVGSPLVITGRTTRYPSSGRLNYRVFDSSNRVIGSGQFNLATDGRGGSFNASLMFTEPSGGGNIIVEIYAPSPVSSGIVSASIGLYVAP